MNKLKTTFLRSHNTKHTDDRRSQQFAKKLTASQFPSFDDSDPNGSSPLGLRPDELSEMEQQAYRTWWKDLDPFSIGHLDNEALLKFVRGCCLPDHKLEQILDLFKDLGDGLNEEQFYAMLRLIAHAQNGRMISRDMVFLGAPIPRFNTNAIDALIKASSATTPNVPAVTAQINTKSDNGNTGTWQQGTQASQSPWIQINHTTIQQRPTSWYVDQQPLPPYSTDVQPSAPLLSPPIAPLSSKSPFSGSTNKQSFGSSISTAGAYETPTSSNPPTLQWPQLPPLQSLSNNPTSHSSTIMGAGARSEQKLHPYTHSRSRSVPYAIPQSQPLPQPSETAFPEREPSNLFVFDTVAATPTKQQQQQHRSSPLTSRASIDSDSFQRLSSAIDTGQSLLLTKKFVPPKASNNPFESALEESPRREPVSLSYSPFADQINNDSDVTMVSSTTPAVGMGKFGNKESEELVSAPPWPKTNRENVHPNKQHLYPPPVPSQATKPAFLKYSRNDPPGSLRRTQSYGTRTPGTPLDPFNTSSILDSPPFSTPTTDTIFSTSNNNTNVLISEFSHGNKLFRHKSVSSSLMPR